MFKRFNQSVCAVIKLYRLRNFLQKLSGHATQQSRALAETFFEVYFSSHGGLGYCHHFIAKTMAFCQLIHDLFSDQSRVHV